MDVRRGHGKLAAGVVCVLAVAGCGSKDKASTTTAVAKPPPPKHIGQGVDYSGSGQAGGRTATIKVRITPLTFTARAHAKQGKLARLELRIENLGKDPFRDTAGAFALTDHLGNLYVQIAGAAFQPPLAGAHGAIVVPPGAQRTGYIGYRVPAGVRITGLTFTSSVTSDQLMWTVP